MFTNVTRYDEPYPLLYAERVWSPADYAALRSALPDPALYIPNNTGKHLHPGRASFSLVPRRLNLLPTEQRDFWYGVREQLFDPALLDSLERRLGLSVQTVYPFACLMRDTRGYKIDVHPDWKMKVITVQFYLPGDESLRAHGTEIYDKDKQFVRTLPFLPNTAYAFARSDTSYHAVSELPDVVRDSLMLTYNRERWDEY